jgi:hypothetical protein
MKNIKLKAIKLFEGVLILFKCCVDKLSTHKYTSTSEWHAIFIQYYEFLKGIYIHFFQIQS